MSNKTLPEECLPFKLNERQLSWLTPTGLKVPKSAFSTNKADLPELGRWIGNIGRANKWHRADWINLMMEKEDYSAATCAAYLGIAVQTVYNEAATGRAYAHDERIDGVSFAHHALIQGRDPESRDVLLRYADREGLDRDRFRDHIALPTAVKPKTARSARTPDQRVTGGENKAESHSVTVTPEPRTDDYAPTGVVHLPASPHLANQGRPLMLSRETSARLLAMFGSEAEAEKQLETWVREKIESLNPTHERMSRLDVQAMGMQA